MAITNYLFDDDAKEFSMHETRVRIVKYLNYFNIFLNLNTPIWWLLYPQVPLVNMLLAWAIGITGLIFSFWLLRVYRGTYWLRYVATFGTIGSGFALVLTSFGAHNEMTSTVCVGFMSFSLVAAFGCTRLITVLIFVGVIGAWSSAIIFPIAYVGSTDIETILRVQGSLNYWWVVNGGFGYFIARQIRSGMITAIKKQAESEAKAKEIVSLQAQQEEDRKLAEKERQDLLDKLAKQVESEMGQINNSVNDSISTLRESFSDVLQAVETTSGKATEIRDLSKFSADSVAIVTRASDELNSSIGEISTQFVESSRVSKQAIEQINAVISKMQSLSESAEEIEEFVETITEIASQTNLLALNAAIEAARANEAGKGFAVVAGEVKGLSSQTTEAADMIADQIARVQGMVVDSSDMSGKTNEIVEHIGAILTGLSSAVEQQTSATQSISESIKKASSAAEKASINATEIDNAVMGIQNQVNGAKQVADDLTNEATTMKSTVKELTGRIRQA